MRMYMDADFAIFIKSVSAARKKTLRTIAEGLEVCANMILKKSQEYVPVDTGALKASGRVMVVEQGQTAPSERPIAFVIYGGMGVEFAKPHPELEGAELIHNANVTYATYVHEDTTKFHEPPTQAKFLERATKELRGSMSNVMKRTLKTGRVGVSELNDWEG